MKPAGNERMLTPSGVFFRSGASVPDEYITAVEGVIEEHGQLTIKPLLVGDDMLVLQAFKGKGMKDPIHQHDDHESIAYLVKGRMPPGDRRQGVHRRGRRCVDASARRAAFQRGA